EGDGVVFVDDWNDPMLKQTHQGVAGVQMPFMMLQIIMREENLGGLQMMAGKKFLVGRHEAGLSDRRARLQLREFRGTTLVTQRAHPGTHSTRTDQDNIAAFFPL